MLEQKSEAWDCAKQSGDYEMVSVQFKEYSPECEALLKYLKDYNKIINIFTYF